MDGIEGVSPDGTVAGLFTPENNSAALIYLRRLIGCTFDYIWTPGGSSGSGGGACNDVNDVLAQLVAVINWGMLAVIAAVATYLIFASLKDTANDGELGGRSKNPSWTLVMAGLAAILVFPAFNGFSTLQMATMQVAVWASGFGDNTWRVVGDKMANANATAATFKTLGAPTMFSDPANELVLRQQIAEALRTRVEGELCANMVAKGASDMATPGIDGSNALQAVVGSNENGRIIQQTLYYQGVKQLNSSAGMCGSVSVAYTAPTSESAAFWTQVNIFGPNPSEQAKIIATASKYRMAAAQAAATTLLTNIQTEASKLYSELFPANAPREFGPMQVDAINRAVRDVIAKTKEAGAKALTDAPNELSAATAGALKGNHDNGWFYAILYQQMLVRGSSAMHDLGNAGLHLTSVPADRDFGSVWGCRSVLNWGGRRCGDIEEVYFRAYSADLAALDRLTGAFTNAAAGTSGLGTNPSAPGMAEMGDPGGLAVLVTKFFNWLRPETASDAAWRNPIPEIVASGNTLMNAGTAVLAGSAVASVGGDFFSKTIAGKLFSTLGELTSPVGWGLWLLGAALAIAVPWIPIIYFFLAALSWLVMVVQTIIAAPFWLMQMFYANRSGGLAGTGLEKALVALLAVLIRPALIIVGLVFCMYLMHVGLDFLNAITAGTVALFGVSSDSFGSSVNNVMWAIAGFGIYVSAILTMVAICCQLIDGVGDMVLEAVERGASHLFSSDARHRTEGIVGNPSGAIAAAGFISSAKNAGKLAGTSVRQLAKHGRPGRE